MDNKFRCVATAPLSWRGLYPLSIRRSMLSQLKDHSRIPTHRTQISCRPRVYTQHPARCLAGEIAQYVYLVADTLVLPNTEGKRRRRQLNETLWWHCLILWARQSGVLRQMSTRCIKPILICQTRRRAVYRMDLKSIAEKLGCLTFWLFCFIPKIGQHGRLLLNAVGHKTSILTTAQSCTCQPQCTSYINSLFML